MQILLITIHNVHSRLPDKSLSHGLEFLLTVSFIKDLSF